MSKSMKYSVASFFALFLLIFGFSGKSSAASLSDIPTTGSSEITYLLEQEIITGYPDGTFRPAQNLTRDEAAIMIGKALGLDGAQRTTIFPDVSAGSVASGYIQSAYDRGIIKGMEDGTFNPKASITRGQMSLLLQRAFSLTETSGITFPDVELSSAFYSAVDTIATAGLTNGYSDGTFRPTSSVTRAEFAMFVARGLNESFRLNVAARHIIAIDAGHGGKDPGSSGNEIIEKELNLAVALKVQSILQEKGIEVYMTRSDDTFIELADRVTNSVNAGADTFVSIHANSFTTDTANGTETYYAADTRVDDSKQLATFIQNRLYAALGTTNRGVKTAQYVVLYTNPLPSALVELGFLTNSSDASKLASDDYRNTAAEAITQGIQDYYDWKY